MKYAAEFMCKVFNQKYLESQWVELRDGRYGKILSQARVYENEAGVSIEIEGEQKFINPALVTQLQPKCNSI